MSELTEGLDRIRSWFTEKIPDRISQIAPGISLEEIDKNIVTTQA
jgi:cell wall assembly regulator SMI1